MNTQNNLEPLNTPFMSVSEAAEYIGVSQSLLNKLRVEGGGPAYSKIARRIVYSANDIVGWLNEHKHNSTSSYLLK